MKKVKKLEIDNNNEENVVNQRREFLTKAATVSAGIALSAIAGSSKLLGQNKSVALNKTSDVLFLTKEGKLMDGTNLLKEMGFDIDELKANKTGGCNCKKRCDDRCFCKGEGGFHICQNLHFPWPFKVKPTQIIVTDENKSVVKACSNTFGSNNIVLPTSKADIINLIDKKIILGPPEFIKEIRGR